MNPWKFIIATLAIFTAGTITGGLLVGYGVRQLSRQQRQENPPFRAPGNFNAQGGPTNREARPGGNFAPLRQPGILAKDFVLRLDADVRLSPEQHERINQIVLEGQQRNKEIMERVTPDLRREMMETQRRIREVLREDQRALFEALMKKNKQRQPELRRNAPPAGELQPKPNQE